MARSLKIIVFLVAATLNFAARAELSLPENQPELMVTDVSVLGSNDQGIGLKPSESVPNFTVSNHQGEPTTFDDLRSDGPLLVIFYRGGWCPYCNLQIRQITQAWDEFSDRDVLPVLMSVDRTDGAALAQKTYEIPFPVLSDTELAAHKAFDVVLEVDATTVEKYKTYGIDLEAWSGRSDGKIAVSSAFLVDEDGVVQWAHTSLDYKTRPSVAQLLSVIDSQAP